jgi:hypothetical protein
MPPALARRRGNLRKLPERRGNFRNVLGRWALGLQLEMRAAEEQAAVEKIGRKEREAEEVGTRGVLEGYSSGTRGGTRVGM